MSSKKLLKAFYFSSEERKDYIETRLDNLAKISNHSTSYIIEDLILKGLLPENEDAKFLLMHKLVGANGVRSTLESIFSNNISDELGYAKYNNLRPVIDFAIDNICINLFNDEENYSTKYFFSQFKEIVNRINIFSEYCIDYDEKNRYERCARQACILLEELKDDDKIIYIPGYLEIVRDCWELLYDWSITYKFLAELVRINKTGWNEDIVVKEELHKIISEISKEWLKKTNNKIDFSKSDRTVPALVKIRYTKNNEFPNGTNVYVNDVPMGIVYSVFSKKEDLIWDVIENKQAVKFALKKKEIFQGILESLKEYKNANGYEKIIIASYNEGIASFFTEESLEKCGFKKSDEYGPSLYLLR